MEDRARILTMEQQDEHEGAVGLQLLRRREGNDRVAGFLRDTYRISLAGSGCVLVPTLVWPGLVLVVFAACLCGYAVIRGAIPDYRGEVFRPLEAYAALGVVIHLGLSAGVLGFRDGGSGWYLVVGLAVVWALVFRWRLAYLD